MSGGCRNYRAWILCKRTEERELHSAERIEQSAKSYSDVQDATHNQKIVTGTRPNEQTL